MKEIKVKCPAKINLDLIVEKKDPQTGFHNIKSIMQAISLFDYLVIKLSEGEGIRLSGNSVEIPYDERNICYKAARLFFDELNKDYLADIYIDKNIPVCAGLAGGSTNAVGVLWGLNKILDCPFSLSRLHDLAAKLGSDLNFCLAGGTKLCKGRGEQITQMPFFDFDLCLVKPRNLQISTKDAYQAFDDLTVEPNLRNSLEFALLDKYEDLKYLNSLGMQMSGSGPTFFKRGKKLDFEIDRTKYLVIENLKSVSYGVCEA